MSVQDDQRERQLIESFQFKRIEGGGRGGTDAVLTVNHIDLLFEVKSTTRDSVSTARDVGSTHIMKWRTKHWIFGFYSSPTTLDYCHYGSPTLMRPWIDKLQGYIAADVQLAKRVPVLISLEVMREILGDRPLYTLEDAKSLHKRQWSMAEYKEQMDLKGGYSPSRMLEIMRKRCAYILSRGATLNNPHIEKSYFKGWERIAPGDRVHLKRLVRGYLDSLE